MAIMGRHVFDGGYDVRDHAAPFLQTKRLNTTRRNDVRTYSHVWATANVDRCFPAVTSKVSELLSSCGRLCLFLHTPVTRNHDLGENRRLI
jgi:hypothetical protein